MAARIDPPPTSPARPQRTPAPSASPEAPAPAPAAARPEAQPSTGAPAPADGFQARYSPRPSVDGAPSRASQAPLPQRSLGFEEVVEGGATAATEKAISGSAQPAAPIRDNQTATSTIHFDEDVDLKSLKVNLDVSHTWRGDLVVKLTSPSGKTATLSNREGGSRDDVKGTFDLSEAFKGESSKGDWTLTVEDRAARDEGTLNAWSVDAAGEVKEPPQPEITPVAISELEARYGWSQGSWQDRLLKAADAKTGSADGKVSVKELDGYLAAPDDLQFLTSTAMQQERAQVASGAKAVEAFDTGWQRNLAQAADGNKDGSLTSTELNSYLTSVKSAGTNAATQWMPDQKAAPIDSRIADFTREADFLTPVGGLPNGTILSKNYMRMSADTEKRVPQWVSYRLTAADIAERPPGVKRRDNFYPDPELGSKGSQLSDYKGSGYDRGHQKPAMDSPNQEAMDETFLLSNMAPQHAALNQKSWVLLEQATGQLVQATGARATVITGGMFLDAQGNPLPEDQTKWIGAGGQERVAVPTHFFKAVVLEFPDGTAKSFAYLCPHTTKAGSQSEQLAFLAANRVSVDQLEQKLGEDLFHGLDPSVEAQIEADPMPSFVIPNAQKYTVASALWPQS